MDKNININLPPQFNLLLLKKKNELNITIYNNNYKLNIFCNLIKQKIHINKYNNTLKIINCFLKNNYILINNYINNFLKNIDIYTCIKIKFKGKGFKLGFYKKNKILNFFFGSSHKNTFLFNNIILKKINKYKFLIKNSNIKILNRLALNIINIKKINFYTLRGLRISRNKIIKRKGRKGTFI